MKRIVIAAAAGLGLLAAGCGDRNSGTPVLEAAEMIPGTGVTAEVTELADGRFRVDYRFAEPHSALIFARSKADHRIGAWQVEEAGARLERVGGFDTLLFDTPREAVTLTLEPRFARPEGDYSPFVAFSDGGLALFTGQFELLPVAGRAAVETLEGSLESWEGEQPTFGVRVVSDRRLVHDGAVSDTPVTDISRGSGTYVYLGDGEIVEGRSYVGVIDAGLPAWIRDSIDTDFEAMFDRYEAGWGFALPQRAVLYFAYSGDENEGFSNKGGVAGRVIMLDASGAAMSEAHPVVRRYLLWFFAHEVVHQFQNHAGAAHADVSDSWLHEGSANTMAHRVMAGITEDPDAYLVREYETARSDCAAALADGPLTGAATRGQFQAHYACGSLIGLMSEAAVPGADLYAIWNAFQARAIDADVPLSGPLWFETLAGLGAGAREIEAIRTLVDTPLDDPQAALREAMDITGVNAEFGPDGAITALSLPDDA